jgi:hypothetical protein
VCLDVADVVRDEPFILRKKILFRAYDGSSRPNVSP